MKRFGSNKRKRALRAVTLESGGVVVVALLLNGYKRITIDKRLTLAILFVDFRQ